MFLLTRMESTGVLIIFSDVEFLSTAPVVAELKSHFSYGNLSETKAQVLSDIIRYN